MLSRILVLVFFILSVSVTVYSYEKVLEDYAVNILTTLGVTVSEVVCDHTDAAVQYCKVTSVDGKVYDVTCSKTEVPGNDKYLCVVN